MSSLLFLCARRDPVAWRDMWTRWRYSEVVEFAIEKVRERDAMMEEIAEEEHETAEGYIVGLLSRIVERL